MFKDRHFQVKIAKDSETQPVDTIPTYLIHPDILSKERIRYVAGTVVTVLVARKLVNTACDAALIVISK